jgi:hypothetical protein
LYEEFKEVELIKVEVRMVGNRSWGQGCFWEI